MLPTICPATHNADAIVALCDQGTEEWLKLRKGLITASNISNVVTSLAKASKGKGRESYLCKLVGQRLMHHRQIEKTNAAMDRGHYLEPIARGAYEIATGNAVTQVGFVWRDAERQVGCSPDGLLTDRGLEIKCPEETEAIRMRMKDKVPTEHLPQIQLSMWATGLDLWDFCSYHNDPGIPLFIRTVERDETMMAAFDEHVPAFVEQVTELTERIRGAA